MPVFFLASFCFGGDISGVLCRVLMTPGLWEGGRVGVELLSLSAFVLSHYHNAKRTERLVAQLHLSKCWMACRINDHLSIFPIFGHVEILPCIAPSRAKLQ